MTAPGYRLDEAALEAAYKAYLDCPIDMCGDHDEECEKTVRAAIVAYLAAAPQPEPPADLVERAKALFIGLAENMRHERDGDGMWCGDSNSWVNIKIQAEKIAALAQEHAAAEKARADELDRECQESMKTIAEERARADKAEKALAEIAEQDVTEIALDPDWPRRIAAAAIRARKGGGDA